MAVVTHPHLAPKLKKEYSYTSAFPLGLRALIYAERYFCLYFCNTWPVSKVRELIAVEVLHSPLLNNTVVAFKVLPLGCYASMPAPSPPFKTILELGLWNGLQSCRSITPVAINVIKMPSFQYFLYLREQKKCHWGLDPVNRQGVPTQLFV